MRQNVLLIVILTTVLSCSRPLFGQTPQIFDVADVVVGAKRFDTTYFFAVGKWSDARSTEAVMSTEIHCYKTFTFCEEADAHVLFGQATVGLESYDILRWDVDELIAVDSSPICFVNTLRVDFKTKRVTNTMAPKGEVKDPFCKGLEGSTAFLGGVEDEKLQPKEKK
jgi:hypothetical protein